jgi:hypothetical protein
MIGPELDLVCRVGLRGPAIAGGEGQRDTGAVALGQLELRLELDTLREPAAALGYDCAQGRRDHPPIGDAYLHLEIVALAERDFFVLLDLRQAPMIGAAIFELDLALLDPGLLDFELGQDRLGAGQCQPRRRKGENRRSAGQVLQLSL